MLLYKSGLNKYAQNTATACKYINLSSLTTYGLGGPAQCYFPRTPYRAKQIYRQLESEGRKIAILGNGSNVLASDSGFDGGVICTGYMDGIVRLGETEILCLAGTKISSILSYCLKHGLGGAEYMYGIPASIGGAAYMNAGVGEHSISQNIAYITYFGDFCGNFSAEKCNFGYRYSTMRDIKGLILAVALKLQPANPLEIKERIDFFKARRAALPKGRSCGCVFKNGTNYSAGELIDKAGLKGLKSGGAHVSAEHANFIINDGGSAGDVKTLISLVKSRVLKRFGVDLREEVVYIGEFNDFNG